MTNVSRDSGDEEGESRARNVRRDTMPAFSAELTLDEFRVVAECAPELVLPSILHLGSLEESASEGTPPVEERRAAALESLIARKLVSAVAESSGQRTVEQIHTGTLSLHPLLHSALMVPLVAHTAIRVQSWIPKTSSQSLVALGGVVASTMTVTLDRARDAEITDPRRQTTGFVDIRVGPLSSAVDALIALLEGAPPEPENVRVVSIRLGLVESRSLIEAIRQGDDVVVSQMATQLDANDAVEILRAMAATMEAGFRLQVSERPGAVIHEVDWVQATSNEWVSMRIVPPDGATEVTAELLTGEGQVEIVRASRSMITAEILSVMSTVAQRAAYTSAGRKGAERGD